MPRPFSCRTLKASHTLSFDCVSCILAELHSDKELSKFLAYIEVFCIKLKVKVMFKVRVSLNFRFIVDFLNDKLIIFSFYIFFE